MLTPLYQECQRLFLQLWILGTYMLTLHNVTSWIQNGLWKKKDSSCVQILALLLIGMRPWARYILKFFKGALASWSVKWGDKYLPHKFLEEINKRKCIWKSQAQELAQSPWLSKWIFKKCVLSKSKVCKISDSNDVRLWYCQPPFVSFSHCILIQLACVWYLIM